MTKKSTVMAFILVLLLRTSVFADNAVIPKDIKITVIEQNTKLTIKRSLVIMLNKKVTKEVLRTIALKLKQSDPTTYERTFIAYYIKDLGIEDGFWARTDFTPNLDVRVIGFSIEQEKALTTKAPVNTTRTIVGIWLNDRGSPGHRITIFYKNDSLYLERKFSDGSSGIEEMIEKALPQGRKLVEVRREGNSFGDYFLINNEGELQYWDKDGYYYTAKTLEYHH